MHAEGLGNYIFELVLQLVCQNAHVGKIRVFMLKENVSPILFEVPLQYEEKQKLYEGFSVLVLIEKFQG